MQIFNFLIAENLWKLQILLLQILLLLLLKRFFIFIKYIYKYMLEIKN